MTKAPFSVEWLSQSSQAPRNPPDGAPRRATGPRPDSGSSLGLTERSGKEGAGPRAGRGGRSRERPAGPAAAGNRDTRPVGAWRGSRGWGAGGKGLMPPRKGPGPGGRGGRRLRTAFSSEQISTLESSFQRHQYLGAAERRKLAGRMQLSEVQIKTWFQNRRMKLKRQLQELRPEPFCSPPLPYGPQSGLVPLPLAYAALPPPLPRQEAAPGGFALAALPAQAVDLSSACRAQPPGFWAAPCFVGFRDPRAFLLGV
ncbi:homeobox protein pv.1-like [Rhea pennata]|uniref:homeobox protein pv.1-like n=1 Tax=Rhea pennata TaxID=8795 RepID=UPI002E261F3E